jgi:hypothetical protein
MTDTSILTPPDAKVHTLVLSGETIVPRDGAAVAMLLERASNDPNSASFVIKAKSAERTGMVGLYVEAVAHTAAGKPFSHMKFFVVGPHVYVYNRSVGDSRANWRTRTTTSLADALLVVQKSIDKDIVQVIGHPVLVELTPDDVSAVESDQLPPARFRGQYRIERDFGRYDFATPVVSKPLPRKFAKALRSTPWVTPNIPAPDAV